MYIYMMLIHIYMYIHICVIYVSIYKYTILYSPLHPPFLQHFHDRVFRRQPPPPTSQMQAALHLGPKPTELLRPRPRCVPFR